MSVAVQYLCALHFSKLQMRYQRLPSLVYSYTSDPHSSRKKKSDTPHYVNQFTRPLHSEITFSRIAAACRKIVSEFVSAMIVRTYELGSQQKLKKFTGVDSHLTTPK